MSRSIEASVRGAVEEAQNSTTGQIDPQIRRMLEDYLRHTWARILAKPTTYLLSDTEMKLLNYYRGKPEYQNETARTAIERCI
jgi:hypothetical protein